VVPLPEIDADEQQRRERRWDARFLDLAHHVAGWSKDPATKVGCVIVGPANEVRALGYNGLPRDFEDVPDRLARPDKYVWIEHAERNAIYTAARTGVPLASCRMYLSWFPCIDCARAIVQTGITNLITEEPDWTSERWGPQLQIARQILEEGKVDIRFAQASHNTDRGSGPGHLAEEAR
jgi:dCMP deaminase